MFCLVHNKFVGLFCARGMGGGQVEGTPHMPGNTRWPALPILFYVTAYVFFWGGFHDFDPAQNM